jgi:RimJ/RimL family protein N-acetyltransferase
LAKVTLAELTGDDARRLQQIVSQKDTMAAVGSGKPWPRSKTRRFLRYVSKESGAPKDAPSSETQHMYRGILANGRLVGVVGIHPVTYGGAKNKGLYFVTIFIDRAATGKGIGTAALRDMLELFWSDRDNDVYSDVATDNVASASLMLRVGFTEEKHGTKIRGKEYRRFKIQKKGTRAKKAG